MASPEGRRKGEGRVNILDGPFYGYWMDSREGRGKNNTPPE